MSDVEFDKGLIACHFSLILDELKQLELSEFE